MNFCSSGQINPIAETSDKQLVAADAKLNFDDNAAFRQKEIFTLRDPTQEDPREVSFLLLCFCDLQANNSGWFWEDNYQCHSDFGSEKAEFCSLWHVLIEPHLKQGHALCHVH